MEQTRALPRRTDRILLPVVKWLVRFFPNVHPNWYTILRIILIAPLVYLMVNEYWVIGFVLFVIGGALDILDGPVARYTKKTSRSGAFLDPLADKLLFITVLIVFYQHINILIFVTIISMELILLSEHVFKFFHFAGQDNETRKKVQSSGIWGKVKFASEMVAMGVLFISNSHWIAVGIANGVLLLAIVLAGKSLYDHLSVY